MKIAWVSLRLALPLFIFLLNDPLLAQARRRSPTVLFAPTGNFQNPGARSFALGGAFVGLADDASAAELNPAGLSQLKRPEISVEYRGLEEKIPISYTGAISAGPFECVGFAAPGGPCEGAGRTEEDSFSFLSLIVPGAGRLTYALYRHELAREQFSIIRPAFSFEGGQVPGTFQSLDRKLVRSGVAIAYSLDPRFSLGVTVNLNSMTQSFAIAEYSTPYYVGDQPGGEPTFLWALQESRIDSEKVGGTAGLLWRPIRALSVGLSYSTRVRFDEKVVRSNCSEIRDGVPLCFLGDGVPAPANAYQRADFELVFALPARAGASLAVRPASWLTLVAEGDYVTYSENDIIVDQFDPDSNLVVRSDRLTAEDAWELHGGAEVVLPFARSGLFALRLGYWFDPDHSVQYDRCRGPGGQTCEPDLFFTATNPPRGDRDHYTGGVGIAWAWGQLDVGYDWVEQDRIGTVSASLVIRAK